MVVLMHDAMKNFPPPNNFAFQSGTKDVVCSKHCYYNISAKNKTKIPVLTFTARKWFFQKSPLAVVVSGNKREEILPYILPHFTYSHQMLKFVRKSPFIKEDLLTEAEQHVEPCAVLRQFRVMAGSVTISDISRCLE